MGGRIGEYKSKKRIQKAVLYLCLFLASLVVLVPLYSVILNSFKNLEESAIITLDLPSEWHPENYLTVIYEGNIIRAMGNGIFVAVTTVIVVVVFTSVTAFIIARRKDKISKLIHLYILSGMMAPIATIPEIRIMQALGLQGTVWAIIFIHITVNIPFNLFIFSGFVTGVPTELDESAILDGCGPIRLFYQVIFPLLKPVVFTTVIVTFMNAWNDFQYSLYFITKPVNYTMPQTVYAFKGHYTESLNLLCGDLVLTIVPILIVYLVAQKYIIAGMTAGAVKDNKDEVCNMSQLIQIYENRIHLVIEITQTQKVRLLCLGVLPFDGKKVLPEKSADCAKLVEIQISGLGYVEHHGMKHNMTGLGDELRYVSHTDIRNELGRKLTVVQQAEGLRVISHLQFYDGISTLRSWISVENISEHTVGLEYVSSFALSGIAREDSSSWDEKSVIAIPHNTWYGEAQWKENTIGELGLSQVNKFNRFTVKSIECSNTGSWSTSRYLPMGYFQNTQTSESWLWQIENNGSWCWEIGDCMDQLYLQLSGPCENKSHWWKDLKSNEIFVSVPAAVSVVNGGFDCAAGEMTKYRRAIRRSNHDNEALPVVFNDYMNCLMGDPTTEKLLPLIEAASKAGCEYFCIDAGWYSDVEWWDGVGEWLPSKARFPNGIEEPIRMIKEKGMVPGLWLEIEVMGVNCPLAKKLPDDWLFIRHGKRVIDHGRYQLDFSNPAVQEHAAKIIERLVEQYGVGYIKMDYNIDAGIGTELNADSFGDGLLKHNRAYLKWLDSIFEKYPDLVIENCGSGGMRMDYALLSRHSIQSSSDQTDYVKNAAIASACASAVCPEQCAVWSFPLWDADREQVAFNMVNAILMRIHQSGHLAEISPEGFRLVKEGIAVYKRIRDDIWRAVPFWPLGKPAYTSDWLAFGLHCEEKSYLAIWRITGEEECVIPLPKDKRFKAVECIYPQELEQEIHLRPAEQALTVKFPQKNAARLYRLV